MSYLSLSSNWPGDVNIGEKLASLLQGKYAIGHPHLLNIQNNILPWWIKLLPANQLVQSDETLGGRSCIG